MYLTSDLITAANSKFSVILMTIILAYDLIKMLFGSYLFAFQVKNMLAAFFSISRILTQCCAISVLALC